ncbi:MULTISPECIES: helicase-related protein [unclassified Clostridium]|uniref:helicase-related protein n=1 Tax=Clostridia TaxID=186801 RepID=UPI0039C88127
MISHVINLDISKNLSDYLHRAGKVGRAREIGEVFSLIDNREKNIVRCMKRALKLILKKNIFIKAM